MKKNKFFQVLFWLWAILVLVLSIIPYQNKRIEPEQEEVIRIDYLLHLVVFFILSFLFILWNKEKIKIFNQLALLYLINSLIFSFIVELVQLYVPNRTYNIIDVIYNTMGILVGFFISYLLLKSKIKTSN